MDDQKKESSSRGELEALLENKKLQQLISSTVEHLESKKKKKINWAVYFTAVLGFLSVLVGWDSNQDLAIIGATEARIRYYLGWRTSVADGMVEIRRFVNNGREKAKYGYLKDKRKYNIERDDLNFEFIKKGTGVEIVFGKEAVKLFTQFVSFDLSVKDIFSKDSPSDDEWLKRQAAFLVIVDRKICEQEKIIEHRKKMIFKSWFSLPEKCK